MDTLDHKNMIARAKIEMWHTKVIKWYSSSSKKAYTAVAPPSTEADIFLFLHKNTSAATADNGKAFVN